MIHSFPTLLLGIASAIAPAHAGFVPVDATHVYAPAGFGSQDRAEVFVEGVLADRCHRGLSSRIAYVGRRIELRLRARHELPPGEKECRPFRRYFLRRITLDRLPAGDYDVVINPSGRRPARANLSIRTETQASHSAYARVRRIDRIEDARSVLLTGELPNPCSRLDRVDTLSNGSDTLSVFPMLDASRPNCSGAPVPFFYELSIPDSWPATDILLHVRSGAGRSLNALFENFID